MGDLDLLNAEGLDESISNANGLRIGNLRARLNRVKRPIARRGDGENFNANGYQDINLKNLDLSANGDYSQCCGVDGDDSNANGFRFGNLRARLNRINRPVRARARRGDGENFNASGIDLYANGMNLQDLDLGANGDGDDLNANGFRFGNLRARLNRINRPVRARARRGDGELNADGYNAYSDVEYSNAISKEQAEMAAQVGTQLLSKLGNKKPKTELESNLKAACGRKPIGLFSMGKEGKKRRQKYEQCVAKFTSDAEKAKSATAEATARAKEAEARTAEAKASEAKTSASSERLAAPPADKFLGMPKTVGIAVVAVGGLALLVGGFLLIKKMKSQVAVK